MKCMCKALMGLLVIVFAWWAVDWAKWALTVIGALMFVLSATGTCCCKKDACCEAKK